MSYYLKDPHSRVDYSIDWSPYLDGQAVTESAWSVSPQEDGGVVISDEVFDIAHASARLTGGIVGSTYIVVNTVRLFDGHTDARSINLRIREQ